MYSGGPFTSTTGLPEPTAPEDPNAFSETGASSLHHHHRCRLFDSYVGQVNCLAASGAPAGCPRPIAISACTLVGQQHRVLGPFKHDGLFRVTTANRDRP